MPQVTTSGDKAQIKAGQGTNHKDLKLAQRRPDLSRPGLVFVDHGAKKDSGNMPASATASSSKAVNAELRKPAATQTNKHSATSPAKNAGGGRVLAAVPADAWVLQIGLAASRAGARQVCMTLTISCTSYPSYRHSGQVWVMIVGPYSHRSAALAAISKLPASMQKHSPFPRQVKDVRADVSR